MENNQSQEEIEEIIPVQVSANHSIPSEQSSPLRVSSSEFSTFCAAQTRLLNGTLIKIKDPISEIHKEKLQILYSLAGSKQAKEFIKNNKIKIIKNAANPISCKYNSQTSIDNEKCLENYPLEKIQKLKDEIYIKKMIEENKIRKIEREKINRFNNLNQKDPNKFSYFY